MVSKTTATALGLALAGLSAAISAGDDDARRITVTGSGKVSAVADMATINTGVVTQSKDARDALAQNSQAVEGLMELLEGFDIEGKDIQTTAFRVDPRYRRDKNRTEPPQIAGYRVTNQLHVRIRAIDKLGELLNALVQAGSNQVSGIQFGYSRHDELLDDARRNAVADARQRAELYAAAAGVALGPVRTIDEGDSYSPRPVYRGAVMMEAADAPVPVAVGEGEIQATVRVVFAIGDDD